MDTYGGVKILEYEDILNYTNNNSESRFITNFQYGTVYHGKNGDQQFTVKIWDNDEDGEMGRGKIVEELVVHIYHHFKGIPKAVSCYVDESDETNPCAIVLDFVALDTVHNLIAQDNFSWPNRIKVAFGIASIIWCFHACKISWMIRNLDAAHFMCDQNYTPSLYEFGMMGGGLFNGRWKFDGRSGSEGYIDPYFVNKGKLSNKADVFAYGIILLSLVTKKVVNAKTDKIFLNKWAELEYRRMIKQGVRKPSFVDPSLKSHPYFHPTDGRRMTNLAMRCIKYEPDERPEMQEVIEVLESLEVVQKHGHAFGIQEMWLHNKNCVLESYWETFKSTKK